MRFLVESGTYAVDNLGDIAMLMRTVGRLKQSFPNATVAVVTESPQRLAQVLPDVEAVPATPWFRLRVVPVPRRWEWKPMVRRIRWREKLLAGRMPQLARAGKRMDYWADRTERDAAERFYESVFSADAVVAAGGGYINDHYHEHAWKVFATLNLAQGLGKPTAMFGIGLGPITRHDLLWHGGAVMRRLSLLALRDAELSPEEAMRLGVPADRVLITGDDAVAVAAPHAPHHSQQRSAIGINLRLAADAQVPEEALPRVRSALLDVGRAHEAKLVPLVVRTADSPQNDVDSAVHAFRIGEDELARAREIRTPDQALRRIARCRVVVTGAYHNAVFALAMGVPVVGLGRSPYYLSKLRGVARQFGTGMTVLCLDDVDLRAKLRAELERLWEAAPELAAPLGTAAAAQVARGDAAYDRFLAPLAHRRTGSIP